MKFNIILFFTYYKTIYGLDILNICKVKFPSISGVSSEEGHFIIGEIKNGILIICAFHTKLRDNILG
jgi:hypothetical protein